MALIFSVQDVVIWNRHFHFFLGNWSDSSCYGFQPCVEWKPLRVAWVLSLILAETLSFTRGCEAQWDLCIWHVCVALLRQCTFHLTYLWGTFNHEKMLSFAQLVFYLLRWWYVYPFYVYALCLGLCMLSHPWPGVNHSNHLQHSSKSVAEVNLPGLCEGFLNCAHGNNGLCFPHSQDNAGFIQVA
jgi:hypothetical protein